MRDHTAKDEGGKKRQQNYESIEKAVVALSNAIPHPWAVVVKALCMGNISKSHCITINIRYICAHTHNTGCVHLKFIVK